MDDILSKIASFNASTSSSLTPSTSAPAPSLLDEGGLALDEEIKVGLICFSKDRPYQLEQLLISIHKFLSPLPSNIFVIYKATKSEWMEKYDLVFENFANTVTAILETEFITNLLYCVDTICESKPQSYGCIMFCVDDLIFFSKVLLR